MYKVEFLPAAQNDMLEIVQYISRTLCNAQAAERLAEKMVSEAETLSRFPYANPIYYPIRTLKREFRKLPVDNYIIFYWVDENTKSVTVARVIYAKRDLEKQL